MKYSEIWHFSHPEHKLRFEYSEFPFKCDGCKEAGIGSRYKCSSATCDFDLHVHCAMVVTTSPPTLYHPFYAKCTFHFMPSPPGDTPRYCNACEKDVTGFLYHCKACGFDLHPCCAKLPPLLHVDGEVKLYLYRKVRSPCHRCGRKGRSWSYRSNCKTYNLHVACVRDLLVENWHHHAKDVLLPAVVSYGGHRSKSKKVKKCCEIAALALQFVTSALLGDPTPLIAGIVGSFMSRA